MNISADIAFLITVLLVSIRFSAVFLLTPLFAAARIPGKFRVLFLVALSALVVVNLNTSSLSVPGTLGELISAAMIELVIGGMLAFGVFTAFAAFLFGGRILDFQMGFGVANLIDPVTNTQSPMIGTMLNLMAVMAFFMLNGHHMILRGLAFSLEKIPPGSSLGQLDVSALVSQFGVMFVFGIAVVAPAIFALLFVDVGMAVAARTMPQVNMFIVSMPLKIFVGLVMVALSLNYMAPLLEKVYTSIFRFWEQVLG